VTGPADGLARLPSSLPGVRYGAVARHGDSRGAFRDVWRTTALGPIAPADARLDAAGARRPAAGAEPEAAAEPEADDPRQAEPRFVQANLSTSAAGVLRGLHLHLRQLDYWFVADGRAFVALVDVRPALAGSGPPVVETRELPADDWVRIPTGVAHGFLALEPLSLVYLVTNEYDGSDEQGFAWDDPQAAVPWPALPETPDGRPVLSDRDRANPSLAELVARLRAG
jgi:dTDP-4-dehydrorhamnose 3,5-epimerase